VHRTKSDAQSHFARKIRAQHKLCSLTRGTCSPDILESGIIHHENVFYDAAEPPLEDVEHEHLLFPSGRLSITSHKRSGTGCGFNPLPASYEKTNGLLRQGMSGNFQPSR
jgi:hypothetical protein